MGQRKSRNAEACEVRRKVRASQEGKTSGPFAQQGLRPFPALKLPPAANLWKTRPGLSLLNCRDHEWQTRKAMESTLPTSFSPEGLHPGTPRLTRPQGPGVWRLSFHYFPGLLSYWWFSHYCISLHSLHPSPPPSAPHLQGFLPLSKPVPGA